MKEYYYLINKDQNGPFSFEELKDKALNAETYIWTEGMEKWERLKYIPELNELLATKKGPPPPPINISSATEITNNQLNSKDLVEQNIFPTIEKRKLSQKTLKRFFYWCAFHLLALLLSYSGVKYFNQNPCLGSGYASHEISSFWPITDIFRFESKDSSLGGWCGYSDNKFFGYYVAFEGIFCNYDFTEFLFYVGIAILLLIKKKYF
jgi:hypothetical protein